MAITPSSEIQTPIIKERCGRPLEIGDSLEFGAWVLELLSSACRAVALREGGLFASPAHSPFTIHLSPASRRVHAAVVPWSCGHVVMWSCGPVVLWSCSLVVLLRGFLPLTRVSM